MTEIAKGKATSRILVCKCPRCDDELQIHVRGLAQDISPKEFLSQLDAADLDFIHRQHVRESASLISMSSRTRTKPISKQLVLQEKAPTKKPPTEPPRPRRTTQARVRMRPITKK